MKIKRLNIIRFGKFTDKAIEFRDSFNVVLGSNEAGKSTVAAFIRFMLYGFPKERVSKENPLPEREKYMPWEHESVSGTMEAEVFGRDIIIERLYKKGLSSGAKVYYKATGESIPEYEGAEPGQVLFGVGLEAFSSTVFIRQTEMAVQNCAELELKLRNLITGAEENVSYENALRRLSMAKKRLENQRGGMIFDISSDIEKHKDELAFSYSVLEDWHTDNRQIINLKKEHYDTSSKLSNLNRRLKAQKYQAALTKLETIQEARLEKDKINKEIAALTNELTVNGVTADEEFVSMLRQTTHDFRLEQKRLEMCEMDVAESLKRLERFDTELSFLSEIAKEPAVIREKLKSTWSLQPRLLLLIGALLIVLGLFGIISSFPMGMRLETIVLSIFLLLGGTGSVSLYFTRIETKSADAVARRYGYTHAEKLITALDRAETLSKERSGANLVHKEAAERFEHQTAVTKNQLQKLESLIQGYNLTDVSTAAAELLYTTLTEKLRKLSFHQKRAEAVEERLNGLLMGVDEEMLEKMSRESTPILPFDEDEEDLSLQDAEEEIPKLSKCLQDLTGKLAEIQARADNAFANTPSPSEITEKINGLSQKKKRLEFNRDALSLAISVLGNCFENLQMTFAPQLNQSAEEFFKSLIKKQNRSLMIDAQSNVRVMDNGILRELRYFSQGTRDAAYLAVRLSVIALIFENHPPLIFDDILATFDHDRCENALSSLAAAGEKHQAILFTCRKDEADTALQKGASIIYL